MAKRTSGTKKTKSKPKKESTAERLYRTRFERVPLAEPLRSAWCRIETLHKAALDAGDLATACTLADARWEVEKHAGTYVWTF